MSSLPATVTGTNVDATKEAGEPYHGGQAGGSSVWYRVTAPSDGTMTVDTCSADFDTLLGVYTGTSVDALATVAGSDDTCSQQSRVSFDVTNGTDYSIAVDGFAGATGNIALDVSFAKRCSDGIDNDGDGATDFPADPGCSDAGDNDETNPKQCSDGIDNDGDGPADFPGDPSCSDANDNDETNPAQCSDGVDNDSDGRMDFPADPGCTGSSDNSETDPPPAGPGGGGGPPPSSPSEPPTGAAALLPRSIGVSVTLVQGRSGAIARGVRVLVTCPAACEVAAALRKGSRGALLGRGTRRLTGPGDAFMTVRVTSGGVRALRRAARTQTTLEVRIRDTTAGKENVLKRQITFTRSTPRNRPPVFQTNATGAVTTEYRYDSFGNLTGVVNTILIAHPATDPDRDPLLYTWRASVGSIAGNARGGVWTVPAQFGRPASGTATVTVRDGRGGSDTFTVAFE